MLFLKILLVKSLGLSLLLYSLSKLTALLDPTPGKIFSFLCNIRECLRTSELKKTGAIRIPRVDFEMKSFIMVGWHNFLI